MRFPKGESKREVVNRMREAIFKHLDSFPKQTVLFVSHGYAIRSLVYSLSPVQANFFVPNCAVLPFLREGSELRYDGPADPLQLMIPKIS